MPPKIIITNDDGIDAPGLQTLFKALEGIGERIIIAPDSPRSGVGHAVTTKGPILIATLKENWYAVSGTPVDCARLGLTHLTPDAEWVFSGINRGGNLGADTYISGTVAAAREAALLGYRSLAISQYVRPDLELDWEWTLRQSARVIRLLMSRPLERDAFWNVNLPHLPPDGIQPDVVFCGLDPCPLDVRFQADGSSSEKEGVAWHYSGNYHQRERKLGRDVEVCFGGRIAVTQVPLDITG